MSGQNVLYVRVSTVDQNTERQLTEEAKYDKVFVDKCSGKDKERPELKAMLEYVREGDTIYVHSLDRLSRNLDDLREMVKSLRAKGVGIHFLKESLIFKGDKNDSMSNLIMNLLGIVAEFMRDNMLEAQREGIAIAKDKGVYKGRKPTLDKPEAIEAVRKTHQGVPKAKVARDYGISRTTLYEYIEQYGEEALEVS